MRARRLEVAQNTTESICRFWAPTNLTKLRSFQSICSFLQLFGPSFSNLAFPLKKNMLRDQQTTFGFLHEDETQSINVLKEVLMSASVLVLPNLAGHTTLDTEAQKFQIGCMLLQ